MFETLKVNTPEVMKITRERAFITAHKLAFEVCYTLLTPEVPADTPGVSTCPWWARSREIPRSALTAMAIINLSRYVLPNSVSYLDQQAQELIHAAFNATLQAIDVLLPCCTAVLPCDPCGYSEKAKALNSAVFELWTLLKDDYRLTASRTDIQQNSRN